MTAPRVHHGIRVPMSDGRTLATDLVAPPGDAPAPAVLIRTPYGRGSHLREALEWARRGFTACVQDVRGRYDSDGTWHPYRGEREDGLATLDWLGKHPWCDGRVAPSGGSYAAFTAWSAAVTGHPAVAAVMSAVPAMGRSVNWHGDALNLLHHVVWWTDHGDTRVSRGSLSDAMLALEPDLLRTLPVERIGERIWAEVPGWADVLTPEPDPICDEELAAITVPTLHLGGWNDKFAAVTLRHAALVGSAASPQPPRRLVLGPWTHALGSDGADAVGERRFGDAAQRPIGPLQVDWLRSALNGSAREERDLYILGADRWRSGTVTTRAEELMLCPDGSLGHAPRAGSICFPHDPADPFPSESQPVDRAGRPAREDVARWIGDPLQEPVTIIGAPEVVVWATTDAASMDVVATLSEVTSDGRLIAISHGLSTTPGGETHVALRPTAIELPAGSRLHLEVTGSFFPEQARNLGTGDDRLRTTRIRAAQHTIRMGPACPSRLRIPRPVDTEGDHA